MPIEYRIDHERRLVIAIGRGTLTDGDVFGYQREVWSRPEVAGYDELMDMSAVERIVQPSAERLHQLAEVSARTDAGGAPSKFAIVAPSDLAYGLGRMYQTYREMTAGSSKEVEVFRSMDQALAYLQMAHERSEGREA